MGHADGSIDDAYRENRLVAIADHVRRQLLGKSKKCNPK